MFASPAATDRPWPLPLLRFLPLPLLQPILTLIGTQVARAQPDVFTRLGPHALKSFVIDPTDLPFVLVLKPKPDAPSLSAWRRGDAPYSHACIAGSFLNLFDPDRWFARRRCPVLFAQAAGHRGHRSCRRAAQCARRRRWRGRGKHHQCVRSALRHRGDDGLTFAHAWWQGEKS